MNSLINDKRNKLLAILLKEVQKNDRKYEARYNLVYKALSVAIQIGYDAGVRIDETNPSWPVVYIELPEGQVSWHMPEHKIEWDSHDTNEKYERVNKFFNRVTEKQ